MVQRDGGQVTKIHYKGEVDDFVVILSSADALKKWKDDKTVPLVDVVDSFDVFITHGYVTSLPYAHVRGARPANSNECLASTLMSLCAGPKYSSLAPFALNFLKSSLRIMYMLTQLRDRHGVQGKLDRASNLQLENEFGTKNSDDAVKQILEKGSVQETKSEQKQGIRNESNAAGAGTQSFTS